MRNISTGRLFAIALLLLVAFQVLYPLGMLLYGSFRDAPPGVEGNFSLEGYSAILGDPGTYKLLWTTLWLTVVRTILAVGTAIFLAWAVTRTNIPFSRFLEWTTIFIFFMPLLPRILAWILLLRPKTGFINQFLRMVFPIGTTGPLDIYSYGGIIFVGFLLWTPILFILLVPAFRAMDASLEESSRMSGGSVWTTIMHIDVPLMRPAILAATILGFVKILESFVVEAILGIPANIYVLTTKIYDYVQYSDSPRYPPAMALAMMLLVITVIVVIMQWRLLGQREYTTVTGKGFRVSRVDLGKAKYIVFSIVLLFVVTNLFLPLGILIWSSFMKFAGVFQPDMYTVQHYLDAFASRDLSRSIWNTIIMSAVSATAGMLLCALVAYVVVKTRFGERRILDLIAWVPWAIPSIVMALGFLWAYIFLPLPFGITLYGTLALMTIVFIAVGFPLGTRTMTSTIIQLSNELEESSRVHGASWLQTFTRVVLPLVLPGFLAGWLLLFTSAVKDLATVVLLYTPSSTVMSTVMFDWWFLGHFEEATVLGLVQIVMVAVVYLGAVLLSHRMVSAQ